MLVDFCLLWVLAALVDEQQMHKQKSFVAHLLSSCRRSVSAADHPRQLITKVNIASPADKLPLTAKSICAFQKWPRLTSSLFEEMTDQFVTHSNECSCSSQSHDVYKG